MVSEPQFQLPMLSYHGNGDDNCVLHIPHGFQAAYNQYHVRHTVILRNGCKAPFCSANRCKQMRFAMEKEKEEKSGAREKKLFLNGIENKIRQLSITQPMEQEYNGGIHRSN